MAEQFIFHDNTHTAVLPPAINDHSTPGIDLAGFRFSSVDAKLKERKRHRESHPPSVGATPVVPAPANPPLGPLEKLVGTFQGKGFNCIFRPNDNKSTQFPNPVDLEGKPDDNVLEINLTEETLSFSAQIGDVPNRGLGLQNQEDIHLNGVPYVQTIDDVINFDTGKADGPPKPIHIEPGLWMHIPGTTNPKSGPKLNRMASIPHGTTINAEGPVPNNVTKGPPDFDALPKVDITPFLISGGTKVPFPSQTAAKNTTPRIPQDLSRFIQAGTITQDILDNPNKVLKDAIAGQKITQTIEFTVSTARKSSKLEDGIANITFLDGDTPSAGTTTDGDASVLTTNANADAVLMTSTFWLETVEYELTIPPFRPGPPRPIRLQPQVPHDGALVPTFVVIPTPSQHVTGPRTIKVPTTQIQYSQVVNLNFAPLTWPHVSVATLIPKDDIPIHM